MSRGDGGQAGGCTNLMAVGGEITSEESRRQRREMTSAKVSYKRKRYCTNPTSGACCCGRDVRAIVFGGGGVNFPATLAQPPMTLWGFVNVQYLNRYI